MYIVNSGGGETEMTPQKGEESGKIWTLLFSDSLTLTESEQEKINFIKKILWEYIPYPTIFLVTIHAFDRRRDKRTEFSSLDRVCISCSAVKAKFIKMVIAIVVAHLRLQ